MEEQMVAWKDAKAAEQTDLRLVAWRADEMAGASVQRRAVSEVAYWDDTTAATTDSKKVASRAVN